MGVQGSWLRWNHGGTQRCMFKGYGDGGGPRWMTGLLCFVFVLPFFFWLNLCAEYLRLSLDCGSGFVGV